MKQQKTTYWLLIVIGILSMLASIYFYFKGKPFDNYFFSGFMGLLFAVTGFVYLRKMKEKGK